MPLGDCVLSLPSSISVTACVVCIPEPLIHSALTNDTSTKVRDQNKTTICFKLALSGKKVNHRIV